jgi:hypothetical protein
MSQKFGKFELSAAIEVKRKAHFGLFLYHKAGPMHCFIQTFSLFTGACHLWASVL